MKYLILVLLCLACGRPDNHLYVGDVSDEIVDHDQDGDHLSDKWEQLYGSNVVVADLPRVLITEVGSSRVQLNLVVQDDTSFDYVFEDNDDHFNAEREELKRLILFRWDQARELEQNLEFFDVGAWSDQNYYQRRYQMDQDLNGNVVKSCKFAYQMDLKLKAHKMHGVKKITNVVLSVLQYRAATNEKIEIDTIKYSSELPLDVETNMSVKKTGLMFEHWEEFVRQRHGVLLQVKDFDIEYESGRTESYSMLLARLKEQNARVIISTSQETQEFYVAPGLELKSFLESRGDLDISNDGGIILFDAQEGEWHLWGEITNVYQSLNPGSTCVVILAKEREISEKLKIGKEALPISAITQELQIETPPHGELLFELTGYRENPVFHLLHLKEECGYCVFPATGIWFPQTALGICIKNNYFKWGGQCEVLHKSFMGYEKEALNFLRYLGKYPYWLEVDGKRYRLSDYAKPLVVNHGEKLIFRLKIDRPISKLRLIFDDEAELVNYTYGFMEWLECPAREELGFRLKSYRVEQYSLEHTVKNQYRISAIWWR